MVTSLLMMLTVYVTFNKFLINIIENVLIFHFISRQDRLWRKNRKPNAGFGGIPCIGTGEFELDN